MSLDTYFDRYLPRLEEQMRSSLQSPNPRHATLFGMLSYHMGWADAALNPCQARTGKRARPVLCLLACEACDGDWQQALPAAAGIELMHNFTLIHDDIEDQDDTRRGRSTVWKLWGVAQGINTGDALFAISNLALLALAERSVPAATVVEALTLFNRTQLALTTGQFLDIGFESRDGVSIEEYLMMIEGKTAALMACACELGALVAGAGAARRESLRAFGRHVGLTFQMRDDVLGIWGDSKLTGKPAGADIARRKKTLPILHGLRGSPLLRELMAQDISEADVQRATRLLEEAGSREYTDQLAQEHHALALAALERADVQGAALDALRELAYMLLTREK